MSIEGNKQSYFSDNFKTELSFVGDKKELQPFWGPYSSEFREQDFEELFCLVPTNKIDRQISEQDFNKHYDLMIAGCSETTGRLLHPTTDKIASEQIHIWATGPADYLGFNSNFLNISSGGISAQGIVSSIFSQIREQGAPKHLFILFPRLDTRMTLVQDKDVLIDKGNKKNFGDYVNPVTWASNVGIQILNHAKRPYGVSEVIPQAVPVYLNIQSIMALESLCKVTGINLIYSTWNKQSNALIKAANKTATDLGNTEPFSNYIDLSIQAEGSKTGEFGQMVPDNCHLENREHPRFFEGMHGHFGVHAHAHIGQDYVEELKRRGF